MKDNERDSVYINVEQLEQPKEQVIRVCLRDANGNIITPEDPDAISMSQQFPDQKIITIYHNGIPETMSVNQLIKEALLQVKGEVAL